MATHVYNPAEDDLDGELSLGGGGEVRRRSLMKHISWMDQQQPAIGVAVQKESRPPAGLLWLNVFAAAVHFASAALGSALCAHDTTAVSVYEPLFEYVRGNTSSSFFKPTPKNLFSVKVLWPYVAVEYITGAFHLWYLWNLLFPDSWAARALYGRGRRTTSANPLRWYEYAVTASLLSAFGGIIIGLNQFPYFLKMLTSGAALQMCGYLLELLDYRVALHRRVASLAWNIGSLLNLTSVGILLYQIFGSKVHTSVFYYNVVPFSIWYNTFGVVAWLSFIRFKQFSDKYFTEKWYVILSLSTKVAIFWLSFATFRQLGEDNGFLPRTRGVDWTAVRFTASYLPLGLVLAVAASDALRWPALRATDEFKGANAVCFGLFAALEAEEASREAKSQPQPPAQLGAARWVAL